MNKEEIKIIISVIIILIGSFCLGYYVRAQKAFYQEEESYRIAKEMEDFLLIQELKEKQERNNYFLKKLDSLNNETKQ